MQGKEQRQIRIEKTAAKMRPRDPRNEKGAPRAQTARGAPRDPLRKRESAVHRSAAPCSPTGFPRSTIGARRLSFRVRNGSGRAPPAMAADRWAALECLPPRVVPSACPGGRTASDGSVRSPIDSGKLAKGTMYVRPARRCGVRARAISAARLRPSPALHLRSIEQVVYLCPYRKGN